MSRISSLLLAVSVIIAACAPASAFPSVTAIVAETTYPTPTSTVAPTPVPPTPVGVVVRESCEVSLDWVDENLVGKKVEFYGFEKDYSIVGDQTGVRYCLPIGYHDWNSNRPYLGYHGVAVRENNGLTYDKSWLYDDDAPITGVLVKGGEYVGEAYYLQGPKKGQIEGINDAFLYSVWPTWVVLRNERTADVLVWDTEDDTENSSFIGYPDTMCQIMAYWDYLVPVPDGLPCGPWYNGQRYDLGEFQFRHGLWVRVLVPTKEEFEMATPIKRMEVDDPIRMIFDMGMIECTSSMDSRWVDPVRVIFFKNSTAFGVVMPQNAVLQFETSTAILPTLYKLSSCN